ncbi:hypothetical protein V500_08311 [Pseudogymnoascus sp. VKM F-4518 (FW-2643)]|nr:hypothetical protein V500_08311 [Pseudogymnoascus sp. VKM F-4518 (FW-2643)]
MGQWLQPKLGGLDQRRGIVAADVDAMGVRGFEMFWGNPENCRTSSRGHCYFRRRQRAYRGRLDRSGQKKTVAEMIVSAVDAEWN